jgi:hypothetical protein
MLKVAKTASDFNFDDSRLARTKELIEDIRTRIEVDSKLLNEVQHVSGQIQLDEEPQDDDSADITDRVSEYFGAGDAESYVNVKK